MKFIVGALPAYFSPDINDVDIYKHYLLVDDNGNVDWENTLYKLLSLDNKWLCHTHYIQLLNWLEDHQALDMIVCFDKHGVLHNLFTHPSMTEKLSIMGPGEAIADTYLGLLDWYETL